jgi:mono/diheme cytochrome c family protein
MKIPKIRNWLGRSIAISALVVAFLPASAFAGDAAAGKTIYDTNCSSCHGPLGKGDGPVGAALTPPPRDFSVGDFAFDTDGDGTKGSAADLTNVITKGAMAYGGSPLMAPWPMLSSDDVVNVIVYVQSLKQ